MSYKQKPVFTNMDIILDICMYVAVIDEFN